MDEDLLDEGLEFPYNVANLCPADISLDDHFDSEFAKAGYLR
jgi:hypothetical protein